MIMLQVPAPGTWRYNFWKINTLVSGLSQIEYTRYQSPPSVVPVVFYSISMIQIDNRKIKFLVNIFICIQQK